MHLWSIASSLRKKAQSQHALVIVGRQALQKKGAAFSLLLFLNENSSADQKLTKLLTLADKAPVTMTWRGITRNAKNVPELSHFQNQAVLSASTRHYEGCVCPTRATLHGGMKPSRSAGLNFWAGSPGPRREVLIVKNMSRA